MSDASKQPPAIWHPTMRLRWVKTYPNIPLVEQRPSVLDHGLILQQSWRNTSTNESEWRDVPVEHED